MAVLLSLSLGSAAKDETQVNEFIKQHLNSIGSDKAREAVKNRAVEGSLEFKLLNVSSGTQDGKQVLVSEGSKLVTLLKLPNPSYHGERFVSDGRKIFISNIKPGSYSSFGAFVLAHPEILTDGLLGGTLSTGWSLLNIEERHAKLQDQGVKKIDGRDLRRFRYSPAKHSDLEIFLYFDPQTARHVMTSYSLEISPKMGMTELETAKQDFTRYLLEERFDDFKETDGLHLPGHWVIQFTAQIPHDPNHPTLGISDQTGISQFDAKETAINHNVSLDAKNFEVK
jgi:hypothetical protein